MWLLLVLLLTTCQARFFAVSVGCDDFLCYTEHVDIIYFDRLGNNPTTAATIVPVGSDYYYVQSLRYISAYASSSQTYFVVVYDPNGTNSSLWSYSLSTGNTYNTSVPYGILNLNWDPSVNSLLASYGGIVYQLDYRTGQRKEYFQVYSSSAHPSFSAQYVSFLNPNIFGETVQYTDTDNSEQDCYYIYLVSMSDHSTTVSACFPNHYARYSETKYGTFFMQQLSTGFFAVTYNYLGPNYVFIDPKTLQVQKTVKDHTFFKGLGWSFLIDDPTSFTYDPTTQTMWCWTLTGSADNSTLKSFLGGVQLTTGAVTVTEPLDGGLWNFQVIY